MAHPLARWMLAVLLIVAFPSCIRERVVYRVKTVEYLHNGRDLGYSYCYGINTPVGWLNVDRYGTKDELGTVMHERKHQDQMKRFPTCALYNAWLSNMDNRIAGEAEAFCEEVKIEQQPPFNLTREQAIDKYADWLATSYPQFRLPFDSAKTLISGFC